MFPGRCSSGIQKSVTVQAPRSSPLAYGSLVAILGSSLACRPRPRGGPLGRPCRALVRRTGGHPALRPLAAGATRAPALRLLLPSAAADGAEVEDVGGGLGGVEAHV